MRSHLAAERPPQALDDLFLEAGVRLRGERHAGVHPVQLDVEQHLVLVGDVTQQPLPATAHHCLEEADHFRREIAEGLGQESSLGRLRDPRRLERDSDALVGLDGPRYGVEQLAVLLERLAIPRREEQRLGVVPRDRGVLHRRCSIVSR